MTAMMNAMIAIVRVFMGASGWLVGGIRRREGRSCLAPGLGARHQRADGFTTSEEHRSTRTASCLA
jgi:hypothetical protein